MKRSIFVLALFLSLLAFYSKSTYSQTEGDCECKVQFCVCCGEEDRILQLYLVDGTPVGTPFPTNKKGCVIDPKIGFPSYPCGTGFYVQEVTPNCDPFGPVPMKIYFTTCPCTTGGAPDMTIDIPCCQLVGDKLQKEGNINKNGLPNQFTLGQNFPNPFNPVTKFTFTLPENSSVKISIYDVNGKIIDTPINSDVTAGYHELVWNADAFNLSSGVYFYKLEAGNYTEEKKMILIK